MINVSKWPYSVSIQPVMTKQQEDDMHRWCYVNIGSYGERWYTYYSDESHSTMVYFRREKDKIWFALRWQ